MLRKQKVGDSVWWEPAGVQAEELWWCWLDSWWDLDGSDGTGLSVYIWTLITALWMCSHPQLRPRPSVFGPPASFYEFDTSLSRLSLLCFPILIRYSPSICCLHWQQTPASDRYSSLLWFLPQEPKKVYDISIIPHLFLSCGDTALSCFFSF